jgi:hypothetical protein
MAMFFNSLVLKPSISELDFEIKERMVDTITAGEITPNSSWGGSGLSGIKSSGFREVGLTVSEILVPAVVKNLLNSLAIEVLLVMLRPSTVIESILELELLVLMASLRRSQVFLGFFAWAFRLFSK